MEMALIISVITQREEKGVLCKLLGTLVSVLLYAHLQFSKKMMGSWVEDHSLAPQKKGSLYLTPRARERVLHKHPH
jgi:hypothetical protein